MHKVEVDIVNTERLQRRGDSLRNALVPGVVELGGDEDLFTGDTGGADSSSDFGFVSIGKGGVDVTISSAEGVLDGLLDGAGLGLPGSQSDEGDGSTGVEGVGLPVMG